MLHRGETSHALPSRIKLWVGMEQCRELKDGARKEGRFSREGYPCGPRSCIPHSMNKLLIMVRTMSALSWCFSFYLGAGLSISTGVKLVEVPVNHCNAIASNQLARIKYAMPSLDMTRSA